MYISVIIIIIHINVHTCTCNILYCAPAIIDSRTVCSVHVSVKRGLIITVIG